jgi:isoquinoline 1-oxidoreductase beta subunit
MTIIKPSRRQLLAGGVAGALCLGFHAPFRRAAFAADAAPEINAWIVIRPDETVTIRVARAEMGQGTLTGLAQLIAEELRCDWARVGWEYVSPGQSLARNRAWGSFLTVGSQGIRGSQYYVRKAGAAARLMLVEAAARGWRVPAAQCVAQAGVITHQPTGRTTSFGKVAAAAAKLPVPTDVALRDPATWTLAGQPVKRIDTAGKVDGSLIYSIDVKRPGLLHAAIKASPVFGGTVAGFDAAPALAMRGVKQVLRVGEDAVAVVADTWWRAKTALDALEIRWDDGAVGTVSSAGVEAALQAGLAAEQGFVGHQAGDADAALRTAQRRVEATYFVPPQHHVTMEPMNATALWTPERCEVWTSTQDAETALAIAAQAAGLPPARCEVHRHHLGGGFGRRASSHDYVRQAVQIARQLPGQPVKLLWTREEDMTHGWYHPFTMAKMTGGLDTQGNLVALRMRIAGQSIMRRLFPQFLENGNDLFFFAGLQREGEARIGYTIPNLMIDHVLVDPGTPPGFWRGVNNNQNAIYLECFIDELAHAAGQDPLAFRRKLMANHPRHLAVLNAVAAKAGWGTPAPAGVFRGLAQQMGFGSYVAACAEVSVSQAGEVKVHRIVAATDPGHAVNPQQIAAQVEGSFAYGLSAALHGEITFRDGRCEQTNIDSYQLLTMDEMPAVDTLTLPSGGFWGGVGEPTIFVAAPAVLNAVFAATGKRVRRLPLVKADLKRA